MAELMLAAGIVAVLVLAALVGLLVWHIRRRNRRTEIVAIRNRIGVLTVSPGTAARFPVGTRIKVGDDYFVVVKIDDDELTCEEA